MELSLWRESDEVHLNRYRSTSHLVDVEDPDDDGEVVIDEGEGDDGGGDDEGEVPVQAFWIVFFTWSC